MNIDAKEGTKVVVKNTNPIVARWGNNDQAEGRLVIGQTYTVDHTEIHSQHTKVILKEFPNLRFNSAHFE